MNIISKERRAPILLIFILFAQLVIISGQIKEDLETTVLEKVVHRITDPILRIGSSAVLWTGSLLGNYIFLIETEKERELLKKELEILRLREMLWKEEKKRLKRMEEIFGSVTFDIGDHLFGEVIFMNATESGQSAVINRGSRDGVRNGMNIVTSQGLVGRVKETGERFSKIFLLTDPSSRIAVRIVKEDGREIQAILAGRGDRCLLDFMTGSYEIAVNDDVVTSGKEGMYHPGLRVGFVEHIEEGGGERMIIIKPAIDPNLLNEIIILKTLPESIK
ncbi:MAG: rod shape-determining protein MreC [Acidobacteriota bacterium]